MNDRAATGKRESNWPICPFVDCNDNRCSTRFSLGRIDQAFSVCFGSYRACPMYHRLTAEAGRMFVEAGVDAVREASKETPDYPIPGIITVTAHGRAVPLRPTGT
jgi:hypothetical protein